MQALVVTVNATDGTSLAGISAGADWMAGIDTVTINGADGGNDLIFGTQTADIINGFAGNDVLYGEGGADTLIGGTGFDQLSGGLGADLFSLTGVSAAADLDAVLDFTSADGDKVGLDVDYTGELTAAGFPADFFVHTFSDTKVGNNAGDYLMDLVGDGLDVIELLDLDQDLANLSGEGLENGSELLKMFFTTESPTISSLQFNTEPVNVYLVAYDNGMAYLYRATGDKWVQANDITLVGIFGNVATGDFNANDFVMVD